MARPTDVRTRGGTLRALSVVPTFESRSKEDVFLGILRVSRLTSVHVEEIPGREMFA